VWISLFYLRIRTHMKDIEIETSSTIMLSAGVDGFSRVALRPILSKPSPSFSLCTRHISEAPSLRLKEVLIPENDDAKPADTNGGTKSKAQDWLHLLVKELLGMFTMFRPQKDQNTQPLFVVDLKYVTSHLRMDVSYEGWTRRFVFSSTDPARPNDGDLTSKMNSLSLHSAKKEDSIRILTVDWNTQVILDTLDMQATKPGQSTVSSKVEQIFRCSSLDMLRKVSRHFQKRERMIRMPLWEGWTPRSSKSETCSRSLSPDPDCSSTTVIPTPQLYSWLTHDVLEVSSHHVGYFCTVHRAQGRPTSLGQSLRARPLPC
jgi:hypothetical protein